MDRTLPIFPAADRRAQRTAGHLEATRESLLGRLKDPADHDGWQRFFDTYGGVIRALALKAGLPVSEADEVLQETLLSVVKEMPGFCYDRSRGGFKAWLFQITRRRIADQFRKRARCQSRQSDFAASLEEFPDPAADPLAAIWDEEWRQSQFQMAGERVKAKVSPRQWQMFDLATLQEWPVERITRLLGANRAQVYMAKMRVGRLLKAELQSANDEFVG